MKDIIDVCYKIIYDFKSKREFVRMDGMAIYMSHECYCTLLLQVDHCMSVSASRVGPYSLSLFGVPVILKRDQGEIELK